MRKIIQFLLLYSFFIVCISAIAQNANINEENNRTISQSNGANTSALKISTIDNANLNTTTADTDKKKKNSSNKFDNLAVKTDNLDTKEITFDFPNTELKIFARFVTKLCKKILIGGDLLKGKINLKSHRKMSLSEVKKLFNGILATNGLEFIETKNCLEIINLVDSYVKVYTLKHLKAADFAKSLSEMFRMSFRVGKNPVNIQIASVEGSNAIMVLAPKNQQVEIDASIKELDVEAQQVLLDVMVLELTKTVTSGFSVNATYSGDGFSETGVTNSSVDNETIKYAYNGGNWNINVNASDSTTKVKVLSQPRVIAVENLKSEIKIEQKEPYANSSTSQQNGSGGSPSTTMTTTTEDVGIDLSVTPRINKNKDVTLELKLKFTSVLDSKDMGIGVNQNGVIQTQKVPTIGHRIVNNTSVVRNGKTLIIGGMLDNTKKLTTNAPPVLGDIPWIGTLFSKTEDETVQTELIILITPTVIDNVEQLRALTKNEIRKLRNYDTTKKNTIDQMLTGKKTETDDTFNLFDYFSSKKYREKQSFIPQPKNL